MAIRIPVLSPPAFRRGTKERIATTASLLAMTKDGGTRERAKESNPLLGFPWGSEATDEGLRVCCGHAALPCLRKYKPNILEKSENSS